MACYAKWIVLIFGLAERFNCEPDNLRALDSSNCNWCKFCYGGSFIPGVMLFCEGTVLGCSIGTEQCKRCCNPFVVSAVLNPMKSHLVLSPTIGVALFSTTPLREPS
ncbi:hypothetical protein FOZ63_008413 [Perkinsus olseni]|uniref:Uncharacterized protein n=1 Tax=Perkinsus olseni TaxID=32597 RepID=A0A7J6PT85_PEROL|nr:hypothetical protein FOZ62_028391 [Perkinsus olseni]KAF4729372.1 hypothetical protein FOZ63_008413 [Perkinsus olseni]